MMSTAVHPTADPTTPATPRPSEAYGWYVVAVLIFAYSVSYIDRQILTLLVEPIKATLRISDVQISLLHGLAFAIFYTVLGIPIARLADRYRRTAIISAGVLLWSVACALCGAARSFGQLFAARIGVGVGEAALGPAAYSIIADSFPPHRLALALSVYTSAIYLGAGIAMIAGGALIGLVPSVDVPTLGRMEPWQVVFVLVAIPGLLAALLTVTLREPPRGGPAVMEATFPSIGDVRRFMDRHKTAYIPLILGFSASSLMWNGVSGWVATHFIRSFGWTPAQIGLRYGVALLVLGSAGTWFGGWLSGRLRRRGRADANLIVGMIASAAALPTGLVAPLMPTGAASLGVYALFILAGSMPYGPAAAALQEITPNRMRAQVTAVYFFGLNMAGIGLGPTIVALFTDRVFADEAMLRYSLSLTVLIAAPLSIALLWLARAPYRRVLAGAQA